MKTEHKNLIKCVGSLFSFYMTALVCVLVFTAYFNPSKSVCIFINRFGEADIEFWVIMPGVFVVSLISLVLNYMEYSKK